MKHFSEAELLETWYSAPGTALPAMLHLADCAGCAARYERLEAKMHSLFTCPHPNARRRVMFGAAAIGLAAAAAIAVAWHLLGFA